VCVCVCASTERGAVGVPAHYYFALHTHIDTDTHRHTYTQTHIYTCIKLCQCSQAESIYCHTSHTYKPEQHAKQTHVHTHTPANLTYTDRLADWHTGTPRTLIYTPGPASCKNRGARPSYRYTTIQIQEPQTLVRRHRVCLHTT